MLSRESLRRKAFESYLSKLSRMEVSVILFGSRARGETTALSDYDLLVIKRSPDIGVKPHEIEPKLEATVVETTLDKLKEEARYNSLILAAILEGKLILDNLKIQHEIQELRKKLTRQGALVTNKGVYFPKDDTTRP